QIEGLDFLETFSIVCRPETYRIFFIIAITNSWELLQYDVKNAFVHAYIDEDIYVIPPIGYYNLQPNKVCKLKKALYG
ncbi:reverse transcriptase domain-containing protein, partial [Escherichia coli]|nr:reverse transcriptase domain-containing protein [Escherichia coli]